MSARPIPESDALMLARAINVLGFQCTEVERRELLTMVYNVGRCQGRIEGTDEAFQQATEALG